MGKNGNKEELLIVVDISRGGAGVARDKGGMVIFVPNSAPGDIVLSRITDSKKGRYAQGEIIKLIKPSPIRLEPRCQVFGRCGGCSWQHLPYDLQWRTKVNGVAHALKRVGINPDAGMKLEEFPAESIWEYRNRVQLHGFRDQIGFYARGTHDLVSISRCEIAMEEINKILPEIAKQGSKLPRPYKVEVEIKPSGEVGVVWNVNHGAGGFRQINNEQNAKLRDWISNVVTTDRVLLDLFGGAGNLSLSLIPKMIKVHCVDITAPTSTETCNSAIEFHRQAVLPWLINYTAFNTGSPHPHSVLLDPPRDGLGKDFSELHSLFCKLGVDEAVAVGCDPDTWARDVSRFIAAGWNIKKAAVFDFFPQTPHIEAVALLIR
ncbi:MAG: TRAM domain-containing protein [Bdellovibrionota bacterium]